MANSPWQLWPSRYPRLTLGTLALPLVLLSTCWNTFAPRLSPLQNYYVARYVSSGIFALVGANNSSSLVYLIAANRSVKPALNDDVLPLTGVKLPRKGVPFSVSRQGMEKGGIRVAEYAVKAVTPGELRTAAEYHAFLRSLIYKGHSVASLYRWPLLMLFVLWVSTVPFGIKADLGRRRKARFGQKLRGPDLVTRRQFNRVVKGDGLAFDLSPERRLLPSENVIRLRRRHEAQSMSIVGDTGSGKTTLILQTLKQVQQRGEIAFIYDPERQYLSRFYKEERGDVILNPIDTRCPFWSPGLEIDGPTPLERLAAARPVANSLYPYRTGDQQFFIKHAQDIFAYLLATFRPTAEELGRLFQNPTDLDRAVKGTEHEHSLKKNSPGQRQGIIATLNHAAYALRLVPAEDGRRVWTSREWTQNPKGWVFITGTPETEDALRPLQSLWIDLTILHILSRGARPDVPKIWFVLDELASLQYLPKLQEGITRSRKTGNPFVLGFHGRAQLDKLYKEDAETILSQPKIKFLLRTSEPNASGWMSKLLGEVEIERPRETRGADGKRSWTQEQVKRELILPSQIGGLDDLEGYLRYGDKVLKIEFPKMDLQPTVPDLVARKYASVDPPVLLVDALKAAEIAEQEEERREEEAAAVGVGVRLSVVPKPAADQKRNRRKGPDQAEEFGVSPDSL